MVNFSEILIWRTLQYKHKSIKAVCDKTQWGTKMFMYVFEKTLRLLGSVEGCQKMQYTYIQSLPPLYLVLRLFLHNTGPL